MDAHHDSPTAAILCAYRQLTQHARAKWPKKRNASVTYGEASKADGCLVELYALLNCPVRSADWLDHVIRYRVAII